MVLQRIPPANGPGTSVHRACFLASSGNSPRGASVTMRVTLPKGTGAPRSCDNKKESVFRAHVFLQASRLDFPVRQGLWGETNCLSAVHGQAFIRLSGRTYPSTAHRRHSSLDLSRLPGAGFPKRGLGIS